jgi:hypothetical protein
MTGKAGAARIEMTEADRIAAMIARGTPPEICGPEMPVAPGRAPLIAFHPVVVMVDAKGQEQAIELGYRGRAAARVADVFDLMLARQRPPHRQAHGPLFDPGQIAIARLYRDLVEEVARGNMRGVNLNGAGGGGGSDDGFLARYTDRRAQVAAMRRRVGDGVALAVQRGGAKGRMPIARLALVDQVCVGQMTLSAVLRRAGWAAKGDLRDALRAELAACFDAMAGYGVVHGGGVGRAKRS